MSTSEQINEIAAALAKAQAEIENPTKEKENPHFKNTYADLASGLNAVRVLAKHGIAVVQPTRLDGDILMLDTKLVHASGQWIGGEFPVCKFPIAPQQMGSAMTYARRFALFAIAGIAGEDDDGNEAAKSDVPARKQSSPRDRFVAAAKREFPGAQVVNDEIPFSEPPPALDAAAVEYVDGAMETISNWTNTAAALKAWWTDETRYRERLGITNGSPEYEKLFTHFRERGMEIAAGMNARAA